MLGYRRFIMEGKGDRAEFWCAFHNGESGGEKGGRGWCMKEVGEGIEWFMHLQVTTNNRNEE